MKKNTSMFFFLAIFVIQSALVLGEEKVIQHVFDYDQNDWNEGYKFFDDNLPAGYSAEHLSLLIEGENLCQSDISVSLNALTLKRNGVSCNKDEKKETLELTFDDLEESYQYLSMNFIQLESNSEDTIIRKMQVTFQLSLESISKRESCPSAVVHEPYGIAGCLYPLKTPANLHLDYLFYEPYGMDKYQVNIVECPNFETGSSCRVVKSYKNDYVSHLGTMTFKQGCEGVQPLQPCVRSYIVRSIQSGCKSSTATIYVPNKTAAKKHKSKCIPPESTWSCVTADTQILMADGISSKSARDVVKGDMIMGLEGPTMVIVVDHNPSYVGRLVGFNDEKPFFTSNHPWVLPNNLTYYQSFDAELIKQNQFDSSVVSMKVGSQMWKIDPSQNKEAQLVTIDKFNVIDVDIVDGIEVFSFATLNPNLEFESYFTNGYASAIEGGPSLANYVSNLAAQYVVSNLKDLLLGKFSEYSAIHTEVKFVDYIDTISKPTHQQQLSIIKQNFPQVVKDEERKYRSAWLERILGYVATNNPTKVDWDLAHVIPSKLTLSFLENIHPTDADVFLYQTLLPQVKTLIEQQINLLESRESNTNNINGRMNFQFGSV